MTFGDVVFFGVIFLVVGGILFRMWCKREEKWQQEKERQREEERRREEERKKEEAQRFLSLDSARNVDKTVSIVGLPEAGKTVYFCVCMDLIQRIFNDLDSNYSVTYETSGTDRIVRDTVADLRDNGEWPDNTQDPIAHRVSIVHNGKKSELSFTDYSGECFTKVYSNPNFLEQAQNEPPEGSVFKHISVDGGVIIIIASTLLMDRAPADLSMCLFNLLKELEIRKFHGKLAIVVTQGDLTKNIPDFKIEKLFKEQQPNSYARLKSMECEHQFFLVTAVDCVIDDEGMYVPPENYSPMKHSRNVCKPIFWLMNIGASKVSLKDNL